MSLILGVVQKSNNSRNDYSVLLEEVQCTGGSEVGLEKNVIAGKDCQTLKHIANIMCQFVEKLAASLSNGEIISFSILNVICRFSPINL